MLLLYDASQVCSMLKKTQALQYLQTIITDILQGERHDRILAIQEKKTEPLDFGIHAIYDKYTTKPIDQAFYESHCHFVDFQFIIKGEELFFVEDKKNCDISSPYDASKDIIIYQAPKEADHSPTYITLKKDSLAVFFPYDVHAGGLHVGEKYHSVSKCVLKVPAELLKFSF